MLRRRTLLRIAASIVPLFLLSGIAGRAAAQQKASKDAAEYQDQPKDGDKCSECRFFQEPASCELVEGEISPDGWCNLFVAGE